MINNVVTQMLSYKRAEFEEKIKNPPSFSDAPASSFAEQLSAAPETGSTGAGEASAASMSNVLDNQEFARRFGAVSGTGSDTWGLVQKYNIQPVSSSNANAYTDIIGEVSAKYGVPKQLIQKIIETESNFNPNARSYAGAQGLMQLMPANQREQGVANPYDPRQNIEGGVKELAGYLKRYNGDLVMSLAAYNAGPGNVQKYGGVPPFKETEGYIRKILGIQVR
ncbi:lytic transglycosylase domain-containing protein [Ectobacillus ponti]|uniref:Lytic transglycosylase domain-containing protein n=1 Tax=Ectobacillus ponti TaxID=2961894 RepID=A0AA42BP92_9BACI|nr:lytic transglycosylase domain-containing protein [Ectobacillus ponti]MCP8968860.1 lytic transglycosylase domain-containing protein [Ectobacillus ponti]